jgi:hypothetical protein
MNLGFDVLMPVTMKSIISDIKSVGASHRAISAIELVLKNVIPEAH